MSTPYPHTTRPDRYVHMKKPGESPIGTPRTRSTMGSKSE